MLTCSRSTLWTALKSVRRSNLCAAQKHTSLNFAMLKPMSLKPMSLKPVHHPNVRLSNYTAQTTADLCLAPARAQICDSDHKPVLLDLDVRVPGYIQDLKRRITLDLLAAAQREQQQQQQQQQGASGGVQVRTALPITTRVPLPLPALSRQVLCIASVWKGGGGQLPVCPKLELRHLDGP